MTGTCRGSTCEEGKTLHSLLGSGLEREGVREEERRAMDRKKERRERFTESEPEEQTERVQLVLSSCVLFAACPHSQVNKQLI